MAARSTIVSQISSSLVTTYDVIAMAHIQAAGVASTGGLEAAWCPSRLPSARRCRHRVAALASPDAIFTAPASSEIPKGLNKFSEMVTSRKSQGAAQAQLFGTGLKVEDLEKPQVPHPPTSHPLSHSPTPPLPHTWPP